MKNVLLVDSTKNCRFDIYEITDAQYALIFRNEDQDVEFASALEARLISTENLRVFDNAWNRRVAYADVKGIHGTLFHNLDTKMKYYPTRQREHMGLARSSETRHRQDYSGMKNVLVIDGAQNTCYDIYALTPEQYAIIFIEPGQDIEFIGNMKPDLQTRAFAGAWDRFMHYDLVKGIHGTVFWELEFKKKFYPNKRRTDIAPVDPQIFGPMSDSTPKE